MVRLICFVRPEDNISPEELRIRLMIILERNYACSKVMHYSKIDMQC